MALLPANFWPKALYIHIPFCASRCPYCDFFVRISRHEYQPFVERCIEQLDSYLAERPDLFCRLESIFLGGGTPSLLGLKALEYLCKSLQDRCSLKMPDFGIESTMEFTMESNPELIQRDSLALWQSLGITRLSVGLQSQNDQLLKLLGRRSSKLMHEELALCMQQHFRGESSFDFIYGIPGQTLADITESLNFIARHQPEHISYYELGIEEGTPFAKWRDQGRFANDRFGKDLGQSEDQFYHILEGLKQLGYQRYEVSNFALPKKTGGLYRSQHNSCYWRWQPYLGLGPSAVGAAILNDDGTARVWRSQGTHDWQAYMTSPDFGVRSTCLGPKESLWEYLLMALRLREGIDATEFLALFCKSSSKKQDTIQQQIEGLLSRNFPQTMAEYGHFFHWQEHKQEQKLQLSERGFDLQGALLRSAYSEGHFKSYP